MMTLKERTAILIELGDRLKASNERLDAVIHRTYINNPWFTKENTRLALNAICSDFLNKEKLDNWIAKYSIPETTIPKRVGLVMAGNIPMVGFQDLLCVFVAGHHSISKLSEKDKYLLPYCIQLMTEINPKVTDYFTFTERLKNFDAVIATGSNNTSRYFEAYFGKYPNIIRKNRTSVAIMTGAEDDEDFKQFGKDVFRYFGLGCRNVSKLYLPKDYDFVPLLRNWERFSDIVNHNKYKNNFDYTFSLLMLNQIHHYTNGAVILRDEKSLHSRIASLNYEFYEDINEVVKDLNEQASAIQCIVSKEAIEGLDCLRFGNTQQPGLEDYADNVDTMKFLLEIR